MQMFLPHRRLPDLGKEEKQKNSPVTLFCIGVGLLLFLPFAGGWAIDIPGFSQHGLSDQEKQNLNAAEKALFDTRVGRRLISEASVLSVKVETRKNIYSVSFSSAPKRGLLFGEKIIDQSSSWNLSLGLAQALSESALNFPARVAEVDMISRLDRANFALEYAEKHPQFSKTLLIQAMKFEKREKGFNKKVGDNFSQHFTAPDPNLEMEDTVRDILLISQDPYLLYFSNGSSDFSRETIPLIAEVEDFVKLYGPGFNGIELCGGDQYVLIAKKIYPSSLFFAAEAIVSWGGLKRVQESLSSYRPRMIAHLQHEAVCWLKS